MWYNRQTDQMCDFETELKCEKTDRTLSTERGVRTELRASGGLKVM